MHRIWVIFMIVCISRFKLFVVIAEKTANVDGTSCITCKKVENIFYADKINYSTRHYYYYRRKFKWRENNYCLLPSIKFKKLQQKFENHVTTNLWNKYSDVIGNSWVKTKQVLSNLFDSTESSENCMSCSQTKTKILLDTKNLFHSKHDFLNIVTMNAVEQGIKNKLCMIPVVSKKIKQKRKHKSYRPRKNDKMIIDIVLSNQTNILLVKNESSLINKTYEQWYNQLINSFNLKSICPTVKKSKSSVPFSEILFKFNTHAKCKYIVNSNTENEITHDHHGNGTEQWHHRFQHILFTSPVQVCKNNQSNIDNQIMKTSQQKILTTEDFDSTPNDISRGSFHDKEFKSKNFRKDYDNILFDKNKLNIDCKDNKDGSFDSQVDKKREKLFILFNMAAKKPHTCTRNNHNRTHNENNNNRNTTIGNLVVKRNVLFSNNLDYFMFLRPFKLVCNAYSNNPRNIINTENHFPDEKLLYSSYNHWANCTRKSKLSGDKDFTQKDIFEFMTENIFGSLNIYTILLYNKLYSLYGAIFSRRSMLLPKVKRSTANNFNRRNTNEPCEVADSAIWLLLLTSLLLANLKQIKKFSSDHKEGKAKITQPVVTEEIIQPIVENVVMSNANSPVNGDIIDGRINDEFLSLSPSSTPIQEIIPKSINESIVKNGFVPYDTSNKISSTPAVVLAVRKMLDIELVVAVADISRYPGKYN